MTLDCAAQLATTVFADSYAEARRKFVEAAPHARAYECSTKGPTGEALYTDAAYYGCRDAKCLLILVSGTHGAEGYCGSAAQLAFLQANLHENLPIDTAVLLVHALNCYGFAWDRRVTAEGCDLNRNFIDFSRPIPSNPGYEELASHLVPVDITPEGLSRAEAVISEYRKKHGEFNFHSARKSGQYTVPGGMFYGGKGPTEARLTLEQIVSDFNVASREQVIIVDYHTGLGPYGYGELQCEQSSGLGGYERAKEIFGESVTSDELGTSSSVPLHGTQDEYWQRLLEDKHTYVAFEFGTYDMESARKASRMDHWLFLHHPEAVDSELGREIRAASKQFFYPQMSDWKEMVISRAHQVHRQALLALSRKAMPAQS